MPKPDKLLSEELYYSKESDRKYMSPSLFKQFCRCENRAMALLNGQYEWPASPALLIGQYVESVLLDESPEAFLTAHPEMFSIKLVEQDDTIQKVGATYPELVTRNGTWKSGALTKARELMPEAFERAAAIKADYQICDQVIERAKRDKMLMEYLCDGDHQTVLTGKISGIRWKGKTDTINVEKRRIVDLKVMRDTQRRGGVSFIEAMRYDEQLAIYHELAQQMYGGDWECYVAVITKESPSGIELARIPDWRINELKVLIEEYTPHVAEVWQGKRPPTRCEVCDWCRETKIITEPIDSDLVGMSREELIAVGGSRG